MEATRVYSRKAEKYARYRWDYASEAIAAICAAAGIGPASVVADIGAGTGILTKWFGARVGRVFAVEPNTEMAAIAARDLAAEPACRVLVAQAERVPLPDGCLDLITVAQAIHWFEPDAARAEFVRLLKPGGWLAVLRNRDTGDEVSAALSAISTDEYGVTAETDLPRGERRPMSFFFGGDDYGYMAFPFAFDQDWPAFIGGVTSASYMPDEGHPAYARFECAARDVFDRFAREGRLAVRGVTELWVGRIRAGVET